MSERTLLALLDAMDSRPPNSPADSAVTTPLSAEAVRAGQAVMTEVKSDATPPPSAASPPALAAAKSSNHVTNALVTGDLDTVRREMETQERIIVALQRDNEVLLKEKKEIAARCKELEREFEHLEAKHSLLLSAQQDFTARSNLHAANDNAKTANLQAQIEELQTCLETERRRCTLLAQEKAALGRLRSSTLPRVEEARSGSAAAGSDFDNVTIVDVSEHRLPPQGGEAHALKSREQERLHALQKSSIESLRSEVARLESEKSDNQTRERHLLRELDGLRAQVRDLESALRQKKESIGELISSCQDSRVSAQRLKKQESRIRLLEAALLEKDEFTKAAMEKLRAEAREVCDRYQATISELQERLSLPHEDPELRRRVAALEKENLELRRTIGSSPAPPPAQDEATRGQALPSPASGPAGAPAVATASTHEPSASTQEEGEKAGLQLNVQGLERDVQEYKQSNATLQKRLDSVQVEWNERLAEVKANFARQIHALRSSHNVELSQLEANHQSQLAEVSKTAKPSDTFSFSERLSHVVEQRGYDAALLAIAERLVFLERRYCEREEEVAHEVAELKRVAEFEKRIHKEKTNLLLEQKNTQIRRFQVQLDEMLAALSVLQATT